MRVKIYLEKIYIFVLDLLFPIYCIGCAKEGEWICAECLEKINLLKIQACPICGAESKTGSRCFNCRNKSDMDGVIAAAAYWEPKTANEKEKVKNLVKEAIHIFKYRFVKDLAIPLSNLMIKQLRNR